MNFHTQPHRILHDPDVDNAVSGMYTDEEYAHSEWLDASAAYETANNAQQAEVARSNMNYWSQQLANARNTMRGDELASALED